jgi:hypothetical protein
MIARLVVGGHQLSTVICVPLTHFYRAGHMHLLDETYFTSKILILTIHFGNRLYARRKCTHPFF